MTTLTKQRTTVYKFYHLYSLAKCLNYNLNASQRLQTSQSDAQNYTLIESSRIWSTMTSRCACATLNNSTSPVLTNDKVIVHFAPWWDVMT